MATLDNNQSALRFKTGDAQAFARLFHSTRSRAMSYLRQVLFDEHVKVELKYSAGEGKHYLFVNCSRAGSAEGFRIRWEYHIKVLAWEFFMKQVQLVDPMDHLPKDLVEVRPA